jgi:FkbM family methyltransferase
MGKFLQKLLGRKLFYSLKYSQLFSAYEKILRHGNVVRQQKELALYKSFLPECNLIFDIGANDGHKTVAFLQTCKKVVCCEPDEQNFQLLQIRFRNYKRKLILLKKAVSDHIGEAILQVHHAGSAFNTLNQKWASLLEEQGEKYWNERIHFRSKQAVQLTTLNELIEQYGQPDFIKIDVEGSELQVLSGLNQKINWISFESFLPEFRDELLGCINHLQQLDANTKYNLIADEKILLENFMSSQQLIEWLDKSDLKAFEVLARQSE